MLQSDVLEQHGFKPWQHEIGTDYPWEKKLTAKHNFTEKVYSVLTEILVHWSHFVKKIIYFNRSIVC